MLMLLSTTTPMVIGASSFENTAMSRFVLPSHRVNDSAGSPERPGRGRRAH